jgi:hypothetical protein
MNEEWNAAMWRELLESARTKGYTVRKEDASNIDATPMYALYIGSMCISRFHTIGGALLWLQTEG